jgi:predicted Zn-dependent protease
MNRLVIAVVATMAWLSPASGQTFTIFPIHDDAEVTELVDECISPLFSRRRAKPMSVRVVVHEETGVLLVDDKTLFITSGSFLSSRSLPEFVALLAHEVAHLELGHDQALRAKLKKQGKVEIGLGMAMVTGQMTREIARQMSRETPSEELVRVMLLQRRALERAADQLAVSRLASLGEPIKGYVDLVEGHSQQAFISSEHQDAYVKLHPAFSDRVKHLKELPSLPANGKGISSRPRVQERFDLVRAKLTGSIYSRRIVFNKYPEADTSLAARYARAMALMRDGDKKRAIEMLAELQKDRPDNVHFAATKERWAK